MSDTNPSFLAIIFIGCGSSWAYGSSADEAATSAASILVRDWSSLYTFKDEVPVNIFDVEDYDGFHATLQGVFGTKDDIPDDEGVALECLETRLVPSPRSRGDKTYAPYRSRGLTSQPPKEKVNG